jgi:hypothetical protein
LFCIFACFFAFALTASFAQQNRALSGRLVFRIGQGLAAHPVRLRVQMGVRVRFSDFFITVGFAATLLLSYVGYDAGRVNLAQDQTMGKLL